MPPRYDLDALGWLLFQRLATDAAQVALGVPASAWEGDADEQREAEWDGRRLRMVWRRDADPPVTDDGPVISNRDGDGVLGPAWLTEVLDAHPHLRLAHPSVLAGDDLARVFVPVTAYAHAVRTLERHHFTVLIGPPEMGKTAIARMIGLALATDGWEIHECLRPEQVTAAWNAERPQLFIADDAFGSTEYRPDAADRWGREMERLLRALDDRHRMIWTSRPAPLHAGLARIHRERGGERFPRPADVVVDAAALDRAEKAMILLRHAKAAGAAETAAAHVIRSHADAIVENPHFTPERIRRLAAGPLFRLDDTEHATASVRALLAHQLREPTTAMRESFAALDADHRAVLIAMLDCPPGPVPERELAAAARRHAPSHGLPHSPADLTDRLADHFLRVTGATVSWVHPSWRDLVIDHLAADTTARRAFLKAAGLNGLLLALSVAGGIAGERTFPLLVDDADWDLAGDRAAELARDADEHDTLWLLSTLTAALERARDNAELVALADFVLGVLRRRWLRDPSPTPVPELAAWLETAALVGDIELAPNVERTWLWLLPPAADELDDDELRMADDWLWLAKVLSLYWPWQLMRLGWPNEYEARLRAVIHTVEREDASDGLTPRGAVLESLRLRLARLALPTDVFGAASHLARDWERYPESATFGPADPLVAAATSPSTTVARILRDL